jgi:hypothetical protein
MKIAPTTFDMNKNGNKDEQRSGNLGIRGARAPSSSVLKRAANRIVSYTELDHFIADFAGNLSQLKMAYAAGNSETKAKLSQQFDCIVDQLTLANGVSKSTWANRHASVLSAVLSAVKIPRSEIRVLDLPSSTGAASIGCLEQLQQSGYRVTSYVLGDKYHTILFDPQRRCIFDEAGNLLQVGFKRFFFSLYRVGRLYDRHLILIAVLSLPHRVVARYLRKRYSFTPVNAYQRLWIIHPEVERLIDRGVFTAQEMDVFQPIQTQYDLILSFYLLHLSYFRADAISVGIKNLAAALRNYGLLIVGNANGFIALQKQDGSLVPQLREGNWQSLGIDGWLTSCQ